MFQIHPLIKSETAKCRTPLNGFLINTVSTYSKDGIIVKIFGIRMKSNYRKLRSSKLGYNV